MNVKMGISKSRAYRDEMKKCEETSGFEQMIQGSIVSLLQDK